ncbi:hypothetical protein NKH75_33285, partial [Mesorhizobium sp. M0984]
MVRDKVQRMASKTSPSLGILTLEWGLSPGATPPPPRPGSIMNPATFNFPIISETVPGAWVDNVVPGDPSLEPAYVAAAQRLIARGAVAISSDCGFTIRHQAAVAASVTVPVAMSSLLLLPTLIRHLPPPAKIAVLTYDSRHCGEDLLGIDDPTERARIVIGGIEGGKVWQNEMMRPPQHTEIGDIETEVAACVARLRNAHPEIAAILFECTMFPPVAPAIRR